MGERRGDGYEQTREFRLILEIAEALREEFGDGIDAHPGGRGNEAGEVNRTFRAAARCILQTIVTSRDDMPLVLTWRLRQVALSRLAELGVGERQAEGLINQEPGLGDRWSAYLALAPASVVNDLLGDELTRPKVRPGE